MTLRSAPVQMFGSGIGGQAALGNAAAAYDSLLRQVAAGEIAVDVDPVPLADVEKAWPRPEATGASSSCPDRDPGPRARRGSGGAGCPTGPDGPEGCGAGRTHAALIEILR
jgi:hypothetical protein